MIKKIYKQKIDLKNIITKYKCKITLINTINENYFLVFNIC